MITTKALFSNAEGLDDRSLDFLAQAIEKNNLPGFDYFEFKRAVASLLAMNLDNETAYKSAFSTAAIVGVTKEKLIESAAYYKNVLEKEQEQFSKALTDQQAIKVTGREKEVQRLKDQIERHKADIQRLQEEVIEYQAQIDNGEASMKADAEKLAKMQTAYEFTQKAVLLQIDKDVENIHKLLS